MFLNECQFFYSLIKRKQKKYFADLAKKGIFIKKWSKNSLKKRKSKFYLAVISLFSRLIF